MTEEQEGNEQRRDVDSDAAVRTHLRRALMLWDPIGVGDDDQAADEYDCLTNPLLLHLRNGSTPAALTEWLVAELNHHFGLPGSRERELMLATELYTWWQRRAQG